MAFAPGQTVGEYEILSVLGTGGMGRVYRVRNVISDRVEAMKVLLPDFTAEPDLAARFIAEIRTLASLDHPNIAQLHTAFQIDNQLVMMMEFVEGFTLEQRAKQGPISPGEVIEYTLQILSALSYAHGRGVVHRDIKPANAMVTSHGVVKLMDFGIAKSRTENQLTQPGTTLGSVYYMSPEQVRGATVDARSDLYSVGILLYELLSGRRPFEGDTTYGILNQQLNSAPRPPIEVNPQLPKQLNDLILLSLAKDPAQRFQSADAFRNALCITVGKAPSAGFAPAPAGFVAPPVSPAVTSAPPAGVESVPWSPLSSAPSPVSSGPDSPSPLSPAPAARSSQRAIWVSIGALTVVAILAAAAIGLPHFFRTGASSGNSASSAQTQPATPAAAAPEAPPTANSAAPPQTSPPAASPTQSAPSPSTAVTTPPATTPAATAQPKTAPRPRYASGNPPPPAPAAATSEAPASTQPSAPAGPSPQEIEQARDRKIQLDSRAEAVSATLDNLRRQQEADGYGLRQDIAAASSRMRAYLQAASGDLNNGDLAAAQHDMDRADKEISTLEAFFNHR
jgi:serine/threonine protein kinase